MTTSSEQDPLGLVDTLTPRALDEGVRLASSWCVGDAERARRARLARWQQVVGTERHEAHHTRQTDRSV